MTTAVGDKMTGTLQLHAADGTFFTAECQLNVIGTGDSSGPTEAPETADKKTAEKPATGATAHPAGATAHHAASSSR